MILDTRCDVVQKAFDANVLGAAFSPGPLGITGTEPTTGGTTGVWMIGRAGGIAAARALVVPYAQATPGQTFSLRLTGWRQLGENPETWVWLPLVKVEVACTVGDVPGPSAPSGGVPVRLMADTERLCDSITLTTGSLAGGGFGPTGDLMSPGAGSGLAAWFVVELRGCSLLQFQFDHLQDAPAALNAFWCRT